MQICLIGEDFFTNFYYTNANGTKKWYDIYQMYADNFYYTNANGTKKWYDKCVF